MCYGTIEIWSITHGTILRTSYLMENELFDFENIDWVYIAAAIVFVKWLSSSPRVFLFCAAFIKFAFAAEVSKVQRKHFGNIIDCERLDNKHIMEQRSNRKAEKRSS